MSLHHHTRPSHSQAWFVACYASLPRKSWHFISWSSNQTMHSAISNQDERFQMPICTSLLNRFILAKVEKIEMKRFVLSTFKRCTEIVKHFPQPWASVSLHNAVSAIPKSSYCSSISTRQLTSLSLLIFCMRIWPHDIYSPPFQNHCAAIWPYHRGRKPPGITAERRRQLLCPSKGCTLGRIKWNNRILRDSSWTVPAHFLPSFSPAPLARLNKVTNISVCLFVSLHLWISRNIAPCSQLILILYST